MGKKRPSGDRGGGRGGGQQQGRDGGQQRSNKKAKSVLQDAPLPHADVDSEASSDLDVSEEDVEFVEQYGGRLAFLDTLDRKAMDK